MRIAEFKQVSSEIITRTVFVDDYNEQGETIGSHEEIITEEKPIMGLVYREMTAEEIAENERMAAEMPEPVPTLEDRVNALENELAELKSYVNSIGKTELIGKGTADDPFVWAVGIDLIPNAYYTHNGIRYVWMGKAGTATADNPPIDVGGDWAEF